MSGEMSFLDRVVATFSKGASDDSYSEQQWPRAMENAATIISLLGARFPASILDLACGTGAVTAAMAIKGFDVTGIDCTPAMIAIAQRMSKAKNAAVRWLCEDMRLLRYQEEFDYVCLRDVIFGVFEGEGEDYDLLARIANTLKPGGRCLVEVYGKEFALCHGVQNLLFFDPGLNRFVAKEPSQCSQSMRLYSCVEWQQMLAGCGLRIVVVDGWSWPKDPPAPPWRASIIIAQKAAV